jgi:hypothetical protein
MNDKSKAAADRLRALVAQGMAYDAEKEKDLADQPIPAAVIRELLLGLPPERGGAGAGPAAPGAVTAAGIDIRNAKIEERIELDDARAADCCPVPALKLTGCTLSDGFAGANGKFSHLSFIGCTFCHAGSLERGERVASLDICGAELGADLDLKEARPDPKDGYFWIAAKGLQVRGMVDLSGSRLRAPEGEEDVLNLALAQIDGDLHFNGGSAQGGRFSLRGARIAGDVWMSKAHIERRGDRALFLQSARIAGYLMLNASIKGRPADTGDHFRCIGNIKLEGAEIGRDIYLQDAIVEGKLEAIGLRVRDDVVLKANIDGPIELHGCRIGGTLDLSKLCMTKPNPLDLTEGMIGRSLRLACRGDGEAGATERGKAKPLESEFCMRGVVDLEGLTCDTLDDGDGRLWGRVRRVCMNHFNYRRTGSLPNQDHKRSHTIVFDWVRGKRAEGYWPWRWISASMVPRGRDFWEPWQLRRNWIYKQFEEAAKHPVSIARHRIVEQEYRSQPFEQAIRVARAEGREDFAVQFEILKQNIEWGFFNRRTRWWLAFAGIGLATAWLLIHHRPPPGSWVGWPTLVWTICALAATLFLMVNASSVHDFVRRMIRKGHAAQVAVTWAIFFLPALLLLVHTEWRVHPFHFIVGAIIFLAIRFISAFAQVVMRFGFGYLRRPIRAIVALLIAFLIGWWGVHLAKQENMMVVAAEPVASRVGRLDPALAADYVAGEPLMGSENTMGGEGFARDISCAHEISEPLYALDILVPLVDLHEESRCEVRRVPERGKAWSDPAEMTLGELWNALPDMTTRYNRFWWLMKALYAIAGWFIVSLAILTFAQVNRTHAEPLNEHK